MRLYHDVVNHLLQTFATDDISAETDAALLIFPQSFTMLPTQCAEAVLSKSLKCGEVYEEYVLKGIFIKGLCKLDRHSMKSN